MPAHGGPMNDDIVQRITNFIFSGDYVCLCDHCVLLNDAKDEIKRLRGLVAELLPIALNDAEQGVFIGPPPEGNEFCNKCNQTCDDCTWYNQSIIFLDKYNSGYYQ
jgi:hypothetical protein